MNPFRIILLSCLLIVACKSKLGKFNDDVTEAIKLNDSVGVALSKIDTNQLLSLRSKAKILFLKFNIELGNDTLNLSVAKEIDTFVQAYRSTDFFTNDVAKLRRYYVAQKTRLNKLKSDIELGAGDRTTYYKNVQAELSEANQLNDHVHILENSYANFSVLYEQFHPLFERFKAKPDSIP